MRTFHFWLALLIAGSGLGLAAGTGDYKVLAFFAGCLNGAGLLGVLLTAKLRG